MKIVLTRSAQSASIDVIDIETTKIDTETTRRVMSSSAMTSLSVSFGFFLGLSVSSMALFSRCSTMQ